MTYRVVSSISADEFLAALTPEPQKQIEIFVKLGGDPNDHDYARLSYLTQRLRKAGHKIGSSRRLGVWLES